MAAAKLSYEEARDELAKVVSTLESGLCLGINLFSLNL